MVKLWRLVTHLASTHRRVRRVFPAQALADITATIRDSETRHLGEIRFVVEGALERPALWHNQAAREWALEVFSLLRVWDTEHNSGVLIYVLLADRDVEIIAVRGIDRRVGAPSGSGSVAGWKSAFVAANMSWACMKAFRP
jgi:hypothetical protein